MRGGAEQGRASNGADGELNGAFTEGRSNVSNTLWVIFRWYRKVSSALQPNTRHPTEGLEA